MSWATRQNCVAFGIWPALGYRRAVARLPRGPAGVASRCCARVPRRPSTVDVPRRLLPLLRLVSSRCSRSSTRSVASSSSTCGPSFAAVDDQRAAPPNACSPRCSIRAATSSACARLHPRVDHRNPDSRVARLWACARPLGGGRFLGWRGSSGGTIGRLPVPATRAQPLWVLRWWSWPQSGSVSSRRVWWVFVQSSRWSFSSRKVRVQPSRVHSGACHHNATCWATVADRPRWVTFATSTPLVITSFRTASPSMSRATRRGWGRGRRSRRPRRPRPLPRTSAA